MEFSIAGANPAVGEKLRAANPRVGPEMGKDKRKCSWHAKLEQASSSNHEKHSVVKVPTRNASPIRTWFDRSGKARKKAGPGEVISVSNDRGSGICCIDRNIVR